MSNALIAEAKEGSVANAYHDKANLSNESDKEDGRFECRKNIAVT